MQRGTKRGVTLVLALVMAVTLVGCVSLASQPEVPDVDDTNAILPPDPVLPFTEAKDITGSFTEENIDFSESISKEELVCTQIETSEYAQANKTVDLPNEDAEVMILHCTWASAARTIYIGFINETSGEVYVLSAVGGALAGTLNLDSLPNGEYRPIMYSSDNENVNAVILYQFQ